MKEGDHVIMGGKKLRWTYPRKELEARVKPAGIGAWSSRKDGIIGYRSIDLSPDRAPVEGDDFEACVRIAVPEVVSILTGVK